jgi:glycosyltransferase involved in cell wall biosynthesis
VTRGLAKFVQSAIVQFNMQIYENKELIIVYDAYTEEIQKLIQDYESQTIQFHFSKTKKTLGELRNQAMKHSRGEIFCQWDDDDIFSPDRISFFVTILLNSNAAACFLSRWIFWDIPKKRVSISDERPWEGSIFAWKRVNINYPSINKSEDFIAVSEICRNNVFALVDNPYTYIYCAHGDNTWNDEHMNTMYNSSTLKLDYAKIIVGLAKLLPIYHQPKLKKQERLYLENIYNDNKKNKPIGGIDEINESIRKRLRWYKNILLYHKLISFIPSILIKFLAEALLTIGTKGNFNKLKIAGVFIWRIYEFKTKL